MELTLKKGDRVKVRANHRWLPQRSGTIKQVIDNAKRNGFLVKFDTDELDMWHDETTREQVTSLLVKLMNEKSPIRSNGSTSFDPVDSELLERLSKKDIRETEEKLMLAVLENAIEHFQKYVLAKDKRGKKLFQEAEEWILDKNSDWLHSFENICEVLGLDPDYMRQGLLSWKKTRLKGRSVQAHNAGRAKLVKTRRKHTSGTLKKQ